MACYWCFILSVGQPIQRTGSRRSERAVLSEQHISKSRWFFQKKPGVLSRQLGARDDSRSTWLLGSIFCCFSVSFFPPFLS